MFNTQFPFYAGGPEIQARKSNSPISLHYLIKYDIYNCMNLVKTHNNPTMKALRRDLRKNGTPAEGRLWSMLKAKQIGGLLFRRQISIDNYVLDFHCPAIKLAIELDGNPHYQVLNHKYDYEREQYLLSKYGITTCRFENKIVFDNPQQIIYKILEHKEVMDGHTSKTSLSSVPTGHLPSGRGGAESPLS